MASRHSFHELHAAAAQGLLLVGWMSLLFCLPQVWYKRTDYIALEGSKSGLLLLDGFRLVTDWLSL